MMMLPRSGTLVPARERRRWRRHRSAISSAPGPRASGPSTGLIARKARRGVLTRGDSGEKHLGPLRGVSGTLGPPAEAEWQGRRLRPGVAAADAMADPWARHGIGHVHRHEDPMRGREGRIMKRRSFTKEGIGP